MGRTGSRRSTSTSFCTRARARRVAALRERAPSLAYARKVEGSERRVSKEARRLRRCVPRAIRSSTRMLPSPYLWRQYAPPVCAKVIARAKCVQKQGTHYVVQADGCQSIYAPEGSGRGIGKLAAPLSTDFARTQHATCSAPLRLNHYAVRSREEYVSKFSRGRISSGARDTKKGIATRGPNGGYLREVDQRDREDFIDAEVIPKETRASKLTSTKDLMLAEFARRDFSTVLDEGAAVKYGARLRDKLGAPLYRSSHVACSDTSRDVLHWKRLECGIISHRSRMKKGCSFTSRRPRARPSTRLQEASTMRNGGSASFHLRSWTTGLRGFDGRGAAIW